jgi:large subunit ribosomal protein L6
MSRIGKKPVPIASGAKVEISGRNVKVSGPKGNLDWTLPGGITAAVKDGQIAIGRPDDLPQSKALHGLSRALIANMVHGVTKGYEIGMEIYGTGYSCKLEGKSKFLLNCGFMGRGVGRTAQFTIDVPTGLDVTVEVPAARGENEPYKGKGIRYAGEYVRRKAGKVFAGGGAGG